MKAYPLPLYADRIVARSALCGSNIAVGAPQRNDTCRLRLVERKLFTRDLPPRRAGHVHIVRRKVLKRSARSLTYAWECRPH